MFNSNSFRNVALLLLTALFSITPAALTAESSDELLTLIPADSMIVVRINNFDSAIAQLDSYIAGISPMPINLSMMIRMQVAGLLGSGELKGVNTTGNFAAYATANFGQMAPTVKVLVPVSDYAEFIAGSLNISEPDASGISKVTYNNQPIALVKQVGNYAVFAQADDSSGFTTDKAIADVIDADETSLATKKPIWAYANIQKVGEVYGPMVVAQLNKAKTMMADMKTNMEAALANFEKQKAELDVDDPNDKAAIEQVDKQIASMKEAVSQFEKNPMIDNMPNIMDMYIRVAETLLNETKSFSLAIEPKADVLTITETYTAMAGSDTAKALVANSSTTKADKLINYLQDGAMLNLAGRLHKPLLKKLYTDSICLFGLMIPGGMSDEDIANLKEFTTDFIDSLGDNMALSFWTDETAAPPFMEDCIIEVSDAEKFNKTLLKGIELWNDSGMMDMYKEMGMEMDYITKMNLYEYKGAKVNSAKLTFKATDPNSQEAEMLEKMYGDGFEYRWAIVDGLCVEAIAGDVDAAVKSLIDEVKAGGATTTAADIKQAVTMLGDGADDFFGTFNVVRMFEMVSAMDSFPIKLADVESQSNIAFGGKIGNGKAVFKVAVPKAHIIEVKNIFMPQPTIAK